MILLLGLYRDPSPARMEELVEVLRRNLAQSGLTEVHVFLEDDLDAGAIPELAHDKVRLVAHGRRVTYRDLFGYANRHLAGRRVIVANNDIYFDPTLAHLDGHDLGGKLLCLSRWDVLADGSARLFDWSSSQDAWIFQPPLPEFSCDWHLGLPGCENRLAYEAKQAGVALENPARSVRALHLHLSQVRRYRQSQRVHGNTYGVEPRWLPGRALWPVIACMGRLDDLRASFDTWFEQPHTMAVLVDYSCPDGSGAWARERSPGATIVSVPNRPWFNGAEARNAGAAATAPDGVLCFIDADLTVAPQFSDEILGRQREGCFLVPDAVGPGLDSALVCDRTAFDRVGGYDVNYHGLSAAAADLRASLLRGGFEQRTFPASLLERHGGARAARSHFRPLADADLSAEVDGAYRRLKDAIAAEAPGAPPRAALRELHRAIVQGRLAARGLTLGAPCAAVRFREDMGYTVATLEIGASSHNNDRRPFDEIPAPLVGLPFTQVVAARVSPVTVQFRDPGKLYVLVGTDWHGYHDATAFLRERGQREPLPPARTSRGTTFEVWSIVGQADEALELPTQVMLVARELVADDNALARASSRRRGARH